MKNAQVAYVEGLLPEKAIWRRAVIFDDNEIAFAREAALELDRVHCTSSKLRGLVQRAQRLLRAIGDISE